MNILVPIGETIDKLNILEIKMRKIKDTSKFVEIEKEINGLNIDKTKHLYHYNILTFINDKILNLNDLVKTLHVSDPSYVNIEFNIFEFNQKRFRIKSFFNSWYSSEIKEHKGYNMSNCSVIIESHDDFYNNLHVINYLAVEYDEIYLQLGFTLKYEMSDIIQAPNIIIGGESSNIIDIKNITLSDELDAVYRYKPLNYISGGKLGDMIQSMSVMYEMYLKYGKKGNLYIYVGNHNDFNFEAFSCNMDLTYNDTHDIISKQQYVNEYKIFTNEYIHVNISKWRLSPLLFKTNWVDLYTDFYNIKWGSEKWLSVPKDDKWSSTVFINVSIIRFPGNVDYYELYERYGKSLVFISSSDDLYLNFIKMTSLPITFYKPDTFTDLCIAVNSCKLLIGGLSAILAIGNALDVPRIALLTSTGSDNMHNMGLDKYWSTISY